MMRNILSKQLLQRCYLQHHHVQQRNLVGWLMYSAKKGIDRDILTFLQQPIDFSPESINRWAERKRWEALKDDHRYIAERHQTLGPDLATAHFIVKRGGAVKFVNSNRWIEKDKEGKFRLPDRHVPTFLLEGVDASNTEIMYRSFDNFINLNHLQYLNLSNCKHIDDWCIDRLQQFKRTLVCLDVSGCPNITEKGLAALHKINLRCLRVHNMPHIQEQGLLKLMLEEMMPMCNVEGLESPETYFSSSDPDFTSQTDGLATNAAETKQ